MTDMPEEDRAELIHDCERESQEEWDPKDEDWGSSIDDAVEEGE